MRLGRGWAASASGGVSAEAGAGDSGGVGFGFESVGGGAEVTGGDGGASRDDGGATIIIELEEEDSALVDFDLDFPFLWGSACAEEAASNAINETMPMNFGDIKNAAFLDGLVPEARLSQNALFGSRLAKRGIYFAQGRRASPSLKKACSTFKSALAAQMTPAAGGATFRSGTRKCERPFKTGRSR